MSPSEASTTSARRKQARQSDATGIEPAKRSRGKTLRAENGLSAKRSAPQLGGPVESATKRQQLDGQVTQPVIKHRPRRAAAEPLNDCILGYIEDDGGDPPRSGTTKYRQSKEITEMLKVDGDIPIAKEKRSEYVWVAAVRLPDGRKKYTWDAEVMTPLPKFEREEDNTCDVCGACCLEVLYEFRCYRRRSQNEKASRESRERERYLDPAVAYISKECGRGLLGVQSEASKLRERLYRVISADPEQAVETLKELWRVSNKAQQKVITDELRHFAGIEIGESDKIVEFRNAEAEYGPLHKYADDVFRAVARAMGSGVLPRELAALAVRTALDTGASINGFFATIVNALRDRQALPSPSSPWSKDDVRETLGHFVRAWPVHVELLDSLSKSESFRPGGQSELMTVRLLYLHGCGELHAFTRPDADRDACQNLRSVIGRERLHEVCTSFRKIEGTVTTFNKGHRKKEDEVLEIPGDISPECVRAALEGITWPDCMTRGNVVPEGSTVINAFPLGIVNNYALGLMTSRPTIIRPKLTRMLTRFLAQKDPSFAYTTIQLNKDYSARMHVDGNNDGPSYIIALGEYTGGELWLYDEENGDMELELKEPMRGYPNLKVGSMLKGRVVDIKNKWFGFNGTVPHMAFPFKGNRFSIVYFARRGWQRMKDNIREQLQELEFRVPSGGDETAARPVVVGKEGKEVDEVDEVSSEGSSSDEEGGQEPGQAAHSWAARFRVHLGCGAPGRDEASVAGAGRVVLISCHAGLGVPAFALRELMPEGRTRILCVSEPDEGAMRFVRSNCKPEYAFQNLADVAKGQGHCEVHHRVTSMKPSSDSDLLVFAGGFHVSVFSGLDTRAARIAIVHGDCSDTYHALHRCIAAHRPHIAILELRGLSEVPQAQQPGMLRCLVDGIDGGGERAWGLAQLGGYGVELLELRAADFGLPLAASFSFALLVREDAGGTRAAGLAASLARASRGLLPRTSAGELLLENSSGRLLQCVKEWKKAERVVDSAHDNRKLQKLFLLETKELGIRPGEAPYSEFLQREVGVKDGEWFPNASLNQKSFLNIAYAQAKQAGADLESLCIDLFQGIRSQPWRDDGLLPAALTSSPGGAAYHYSLLRHRPLTGLEVLGCHGMPVRDLDVRGNGDITTARLASSAVPLPVFGAVLCAALAAADLETCPTFSLTSGRVTELLSAVATSSEELSIATMRAHLPDEATDDVQFGGRAAVFLNLVRNASFGRAAQASDEPAAAAPSGEAAKLIHSALTRVVEGPEAEEAEAAADAARAGAGGSREAAGMVAAPVDEAKEWPARLSHLKSGKLGFMASAPSLGAAMRWMREAAQDPSAELASDIIEVGTTYICNILEKARQVPAAVAQQRGDLLTALRDVEREAEATRVGQVLTQVRFLQELDEGSQRLAVQKQTDQGMPKYVEGILGKITAWTMRRGFFDHFAQAVKGGWAPDSFVQHGGVEVLAKWLHESPEHLDKDWRSAGETLTIIAGVAASATVETASSLLPFLHAIAQRLGGGAKTHLSSKAEAGMVQVVVSKLKDMTPKQAIPQVLLDFAERPGEPWRRFTVTVDLIYRVRTALEDAHSARTVALWKKAKEDFHASATNILARAGSPKDGVWKALSLVEDRMIQSVEASFDAIASKAAQRESATESRKKVEKQDLFEREVASLSELIQDGQLRDATHGGLEAVIAVMQEVRTRMKEGLKSPKAAPALSAAEEACRHFCERPERRSRQRRWLRQQGFGQCGELIETRGLLDSLGELAVECRGPAAQLPQRWQGAGIPKRVCRGLLAAVASGKLRKNKFDILDNEVPHGWTREFSESVGMHYFKRMYGKGTEWEWPTEEEPAETIDEPPEPGIRAPRPQPGQVRYIVKEETGSVHCLLCGGSFDQGHLKSKTHETAKQHWDRLADVAQAVRLEFMAELGLDACSAPEDRISAITAGLQTAWVGELAFGLAAIKAPDHVHKLFWHRVIRPNLPTESMPSAFLNAFQEIFKAARVHEWSVDSSAAAPGQPVASPAVRRAREMSEKLQSKLDTSGRILARESSACTELVALVKEVRTSLDACGREQPAVAKEALQAGREAVLQYTEAPARSRRAQEWLRLYSLGHCAHLLEDAALLDRLLELGANPGLAKGIGVPRRCLGTIAAALSDARLIEEDLRPGPLPVGWELKLSNSTGLCYFAHRDGRQQWEWPELPELPRDVLKEPPALSLVCPSAGSGSAEEAAYIICTSGRPPRCLLCGTEAEADHIGSTSHATAVAHWKDLAGRFDGLALDLQQGRTALAKHPQWRRDIQAALHGEFYAAICGRPASKVPAQIEAAFWHRVVKPQLACFDGPAGSPSKPS